MDRKGKQKIGFLCFVFVAAALTAITFWGKIAYEQKMGDVIL